MLKTRKYVVLLAAILIFLLNSLSFAAIPGDANENGKLDVADVIFILQTLAGLRQTNEVGLSYYPAVVGYSWTYDVTPSVGAPYTTTTMVISSNSSSFSVKSQSSNSTFYTQTDYIYDGTALKNATGYTYDAAGTLSGKIEYTPATLVLPLNMTINTTESTESATQTTSSTGATVMTSVQRRFITVNGEESVTTPAGTFAAMKITITSVDTPLTGNTTLQTVIFWYVKNLGRVKIVATITSGTTTTTTTTVLRSYSQTPGISGYWQVFNTPSGQTEQSVGYALFSQTNNAISGTAQCGSNWTTTGTVIGNSITLNWTENGNQYSITGTINGDSMGGSYSSASESGTWRAVKFTPQICETIQPTVVSTNPANGATGVSRSLTTISVTFSEPMKNSFSISSSGSNWDLSNATPTSWDPTMTIVTEGRDNVGLLPANTKIDIILNPTGYNNVFRDASGNILNPSPFTFSFTTGAD